MARKKSNRETIQCQFFKWKIYERGGVWQADGRSNRPSVGRHSLDTRDYLEAKSGLICLDRVCAVKSGLANPDIVDLANNTSVNITEGCKSFLQYCERDRLVGGAKPTTVKRYRAVLDKFQKFAGQNGMAKWAQVTRSVVEKYISWLSAQDYAERTRRFEAETVKRVNKWLIQEALLPNEYLIKLPLMKQQGTTTYCWKPEEIRAMLLYARDAEDLQWLWYVLMMLAQTGARISEACSLQWIDVDLSISLLHIRDESGSKQKKKEIRQTKSGKSRMIPIRPELSDMFKLMNHQQDPYVFHGPRGGRLKPDTVRRLLIKKVLTPLNDQFPTADGEIGFRDGRLHSFRHYFCSQCANQGVSEFMLRDWLGHADSEMVRHYYHLHNAESHQRMAQVNFLSSIQILNDQSNPELN
ncbi:site-specific tyrosine recombinase XerC [Polystyrenella longa]|uniref:Site-specific tyrosine recombinase XerC n=1 Tax=Polystyrenella longa TaxID=2528007 RepID=A0A518CKB1_9PLAN|nr:site-specific integrase [Polystyrenella longa]QDU79666.1 site-specific tyrosine recombinase XerC [Polystyrenella longa]